MGEGFIPSLASDNGEINMSWSAASSPVKKKRYADIEIIRDGMYPVDARIFFGKYCYNRTDGILLSEISEYDNGYIKWLMNSFDGVSPDMDDDFRIACREVLDSRRI